jgi:hypothetical protein
VIWLAVRQFRLQAAVALVALVTLGVLVVVLGTQLLHDYHATVTGCGAHADCAAATNALLNRYDRWNTWFGIVVLVVPGLLGIFWGAPLLARELESGTFRLAWTQSISRSRWTLTKLGLLGLASVAAAGLCSLFVTWWASPLDHIGAGPFTTFDQRGIVPVGYALFAFSLGVAAGAVIRRTLPAMGATLVAFVAVRLAVYEWLRPRYMAPLIARSPYRFSGPGLGRVAIGQGLRPGGWVISQSIENPAGHVVGQTVGGLLATSINVGPQGVTIAGVGSCPTLKPSGRQSFASSNDLVQRCVNQLHLTSVTTYQPSNRYWPFQIYETVLFVVAALAVGAFALWWVRRRLI